MTDKRKKNPLPQEEIDKAVSEGHKKPEFPGDEICADHSCDPDFVCDEPFSDYTNQREQNCFETHGCTPDHSCSKPFTCSGDHMVGGDWNK